MTRLEHHNAHVRKEGVKGIMELVTHHDASELIPYLSKLVLAISPMTLDTDSPIRGTAVNCIQTLMTKVGNVEITLLSIIFIIYGNHDQCLSFAFYQFFNVFIFPNFLIPVGSKYATIF